MNYTKNKGMTLLELLIVIAIIIVLSVIVTPSLSKFKAERSLVNTAEDIVSVLNKARNDTIGSLGGNQYGVHLDTNKFTYFIAPTYINGTSTNIVTTLDDSITIPSSGGINLNGGGSDIIFTRITGDTSNYGTIVLQLSSDATRQKTITINKTGVISSN